MKMGYCLLVIAMFMVSIGCEKTPVEGKVIQITVDLLGVSEVEVTGSASFIDDLGADELDRIELIMAFEEAFNIQISEEALEKINTVQDAIDYIETH